MKLTTCFLVATLLMATTGHARILVDYGEAAATPTFGGVWNTVDFGLTGAALVDDGGNATGVTVNFGGAWLDTSVNQGPWPAGDVSWVAGDAIADYVFNTTGDVSTISFDGLIPGGLYRFEHVAARALGADRIADYRVNGVFADSTPNGDNFASLGDGWDGGNILVWNSAMANNAGAIVLTVDDVQNFGYVSASLIERVPEPSCFLLTGLGLVALLSRRRS